MDYTAQYYKCSRQDLLRYIRPGAHRVLDVGCAEGMLGASLKQQGLAEEVIGIELLPAAAHAAGTVLDRVICGDIETMDLNSLGLKSGSFDYILCADVLEHLRDPSNVLKQLRSLLKKNGVLISSIPNVRYWGVILPLLFKGEWIYRNHGIMDRTHLRFFTRKTAICLFEECGLRVIRCDGSPLRRNLNKIINIATLGMTREFIIVQWTLVSVLQEGFATR